LLKARVIESLLTCISHENSFGLEFDFRGALSVVEEKCGVENVISRIQRLSGLGILVASYNRQKIPYRAIDLFCRIAEFPLTVSFSQEKIAS